MVAYTIYVLLYRDEVDGSLYILYCNGMRSGGGYNSPNFAWLGLYCAVKFVEKCFLMTELVS